MDISTRIKNHFFGSSFHLPLAAIIVSIITLKGADCLVGPGADDSFRWALNYLLANHRDQFAHICYPVGPLCLFKWPSIVGDHIIICAFLQMLFSFTFTLLYARLYQKYRNSTNLLAPILICIVFLTIANMDYIFLGCVVCGILLWEKTQQLYYALISIIITALLVYVKASFFALAASVWIVYIIKLLIGKRFKIILSLLLAGCVSCMLIGVIVLGGVSQMFHYLSNNLLIAFSYSETLALFPYNNWTALSLCLLSLITCAIMYAKAPGGVVIQLFALCLFANWKYSIVGANFFHLLFFSYLLVLIIVLFFAVQVKGNFAGVALLVLSLCFYNFNMKYVSEDPAYFWFPGFVNFDARVLHYQAFKTEAQRKSLDACRNNILPREWTDEVKSSPVDVFPSDQSVIMMNDLNYLPRPSLQSPPMNSDLEKKDVAFFQSPGAPEYIIWHSTHGNRTALDGIMGAYLPNQCPELVKTIITNYSITRSDERFALYKKRTAPLKLSFAAIKSAEANWGDWIKVPAVDSGQLMMLSADAENTKLYQVIKALYKNGLMHVEYEKNDGSILKYTFSAGCAKEGMFANPLFTDHKLTTIPIRRIRFTNDNADCFTKTIKVVWKKGE